MHAKDGEVHARSAPPSNADHGRAPRRHAAPPEARAAAAPQRSESDQRLKRAMSIETVGIAFFDAMGVITDCNDAFLRMSGLSRVAIERREVRWDTITAPEWWPATERAMEQFREIGRIAPVEKEYVRPDGARWWALVAATRIDPDEGVAYVVDITDRKRAEAGRLQTEAEFRAMFEMSSVGQFQAALGSGAIVRANLRFCAMVGYSADDLARMRLEDIVHPEERTQAATTLEQLVLGRLQETTIETRLIHRDGGVVWVEGNVTLMRDEFGTPMRMAAIVRDVSAQKRTEQALAESRERLRLILESARDYAILSMDLERRITSWNPGAERITGWTEAEMIGRSGDVLFTPDDLVRGEADREMSTAIATGRSVDERWHQRKDGRRFWGSGVMMVMHDTRGAPVGAVKIFRDETDARESSEALKESRAQLWEALRENELARAQLQAASHAKDHFLAVLSHELRTPLTPVLMAAQAIGMRHDLPEGVRPALEMIQRNVRIEAHFIDDLLELTRLTRGKLEIASEPVDLHATVKDAVEACRAPLDDKSITLEVTLEAARHTCTGDRARLQQAVVNVLKNAVKFTPEAGRIEVRSENAGDRFRLVVHDTGIGIGSDEMPTIFEAFGQGGESIAREYGGLGLGLAIARASVEAHGGFISADSAGRNKGTTVTIEIPLTPQQP